MKKLILLFGIIGSMFLLAGCSSRYTVEFEPNGGAEIEPQKVEGGSSIQVPTAIKEGYTLEGWYTSLNNGQTLDEKWSFTNNNVNNDITLYANWTINQYTLSFDTDGGTQMSSIIQEYNTPIRPIADPYKLGHSFKGWSEEIPSIMPAENIKLEAQYIERIFEYTIENKQVKITNYIGSSKEVVIPNKIEDYTVTSIGDSAFYSRDLTSIDLPNSINSIGNGAFGFNDLSIIALPNSVNSIGDGAFAFNDLTIIDLPNSINSIGDSAFFSNNLTSISLPDSVNSIGDGAFYSNQLTNVTIPENITSIGDYAFDWYKIRNLNLQDNNHFVYEGNLLLTSDRTHVLAGIGSLSSVTIPNSVTSIGNSAFFPNDLTSLSLPNSLTSIGYRAFESNNLTSLSLPNSVTDIAAMAFRDNQLTSIMIEGDETRFNDVWSDIGFPVDLKP